MSSRNKRGASRQFKLTLLAACSAVMLGLPTASLALVGFSLNESKKPVAALDLFTPASVDPELAARIAARAEAKSLRFTPAGTSAEARERVVTIAVRFDDGTAKAVSVRDATKAVPGAGEGIAALETARFNLGTSRGYQSFARPIALPDTIRDLSMPDLSEFEPFEGLAQDKPSRLQPRIELEDKRLAGRSVNTLDDLGAQTVDLGGSFRLSSKVDVTAGVRLSQERERLGPRLTPLTNSVQDSQAVYVGTQIKF